VVSSNRQRVNPRDVQCSASAGIHPSESKQLSKAVSSCLHRLLAIPSRFHLSGTPRPMTLEDASTSSLWVGKVRIGRNGLVEGKDALCNHQEIPECSYSIDFLVCTLTLASSSVPHSTHHRPPTVLLRPFTPSRPQELSQHIHTSSANFIQVRRPQRLPPAVPPFVPLSRTLTKLSRVDPSPTKFVVHVEQLTNDGLSDKRLSTAGHLHIRPLPNYRTRKPATDGLPKPSRFSESSLPLPLTTLDDISTSAITSRRVNLFVKGSFEARTGRFHHRQ
jgi:hypothetical protein